MVGDGTDAYVGLVVHFRAGYDDKPTAAIVTEVGGEGCVNCAVFCDGYAQVVSRSGVWYAGHPKAKHQLEVNDEGGIWDYATPGLSEEIDKSKNKPVTKNPEPAAKPLPKQKPPSVARGVASAS